LAAMTTSLEGSVNWLFLFGRARGGEDIRHGDTSFLGGSTVD
jgi:hypothetical protein